MSDLIGLIVQIDARKAELDALRPIDPAQEQRIMQALRIEWNYHSNALEGNTLTLGETRAFLLYGITAKGKPFRDYLDMKGHQAAIDYLIEFIHAQQPLTEADIRELHRILLVEPYEVAALTPDGQPTRRRIEIGRYKMTPNSVLTSTGAMHYYASPQETPALMGELMSWQRERAERGDIHPVLAAAIFHYRLAAIHPFDDGNGRIARLLMNLLLMQRGYPPVVVRTESKGDYLLALERADAGDLDDFVRLIATNLLHSLDLYLAGARGQSIDDLRDWQERAARLQERFADYQPDGLSINH